MPKKSNLTPTQEAEISVRQRATDIAIQRAFASYADLSTFKSPYAVTLTFRSHRYLKTDLYLNTFRLVPQTAKQNFNHFMNRLNRRFYGNAARRFGKRLQVIPVMEGGNGSHLHYYCIIDNPFDEGGHLAEFDFLLLIKDEWKKTQWGNEEIDVRRCDEGWVRYIAKRRSKKHFDLSIDWENLHLAKAA